VWFIELEDPYSIVISVGALLWTLLPMVSTGSILMLTFSCDGDEVVGVIAKETNDVNLLFLFIL
jgi:hypothetical protein